MKQTINFTDFRDAFRNYDRLDNFSYDGSEALFDYLEEYEESTGEELELDVIALCCEFSEYDDALDCVIDCQYDASDYISDEEALGEESALEYLQDNTIVIEFNGGIIIQNF